MAIKFEKPEVKDNVVKVAVEGNPFMDNAPEDIKHHIKPVFKYMKQYSKEAMEEATAEAGKLLKKHKDADEIQIKIPFGPNSVTDRLDYRAQREVKVRNIKTGEEYTTPRVSVKASLSSAFPSKNQMKTLRDELLKKI